eukprot:SAG31_NODE_31500_length_367_cov_1.130597_1_plen_110_part_01
MSRTKYAILVRLTKRSERVSERHCTPGGTPRPGVSRKFPGTPIRAGSDPAHAPRVQLIYALGTYFRTKFSNRLSTTGTPRFVQADLQIDAAARGGRGRSYFKNSMMIMTP